MKSKFLISAVLTLSLLSGCSGSDDRSGGNKAADPGSSRKVPKIELKAYAAPKEWKVLRLKEPPLVTTDWVDLQTADNQEPVEYSISYPGDWTLEYSVFLDKSGQKIAELIPPVILSEGQKPFDKWKPGYGEKLVSQNEIALDDLNGQKIVTKIMPDDGPAWYPHNYCLAKDGKAIMIVFYERELDSGNEALFNKIVSTLKFH